MAKRITNIAEHADRLREARYGVIEVERGRLQDVRLRLLPSYGSLAGVLWNDWIRRRIRSGDRCRLYYNQPLGSSSFLSLTWVESDRDTCWPTIRAALATLDEIAQLKQSEAIVAEAASLRISDRLAKRLGWERHLTSSPRRHFIKRFDRRRAPSEQAERLRRELTSGTHRDEP